MNRGRWGLLVVAALTVGITMRAAFLWWSPLPATLDGFRYARLATATIETGGLTATGVQSDELVTTLVLTIASELTGVRPLYLAQPLVACIGGASVLAGVVLVRGLARAQSWAPRRTFHASVLAALGLAVSGMYLRRTGVPDEEALALLLLPLLALAAHRILTTRRVAWAGVLAVLTVVSPLNHNMSALIAAFVLSGVAAVHVARAETPGAVGLGLLVGGGFWAHFFGYFAIAPRLGFTLTYSGILREHLGAMVAWLVVLVVGVVWLRTASGRLLRLAGAVGLGAFFLVVVANLFVPVFPGTIRTPPLVLGLVLLFVVPVGLLVWGLPWVAATDGDTPVLLALLAGPVAVSWFALATSLTPQFFGLVQRVQVHAHIAVIVLAAVAAVRIAARRRSLGRVVVVGLVVATVATAPFAFIHLDTATAPRTVHASEFAATSFAATAGTYAADHRLSRVGPLYYGDGVTGEVNPTRAWLTGGPPPECVTVAQRAWTTDGAHLYPTSPQTLPPERFSQWAATGNLVYSTGGVTDTYVVAATSSVC